MENKKQITAAMASAMAEMPAVKKDAKNPFLKNKYASLDNIIEVARPVLAKHKLFFIQHVNDLGVETLIIHESGESISSGALKIPAETSKGLSIAQTMGVSITYAKRYQLAAMLGISSDDDTDGQIGNNSDLKPMIKATPMAPPSRNNSQYTTDDGKAWITDKLVAQAIDKIYAGESQIIEKCREHYKISKANYDKLIEAKKAYDALPVTAAEEVPELPAEASIDPNDLPL